MQVLLLVEIHFLDVRIAAANSANIIGFPPGLNIGLRHRQHTLV